MRQQATSTPNFGAAAFAAQSSIAEVLVDLHESINAIGGVPRNDYERGSNDAVGQALAFIEAKQAEVG